MDTLGRLLPKKVARSPSPSMAYRKKLYNKSKELGLNLPWSKTSIPQLEESVANYMGTRSIMSKILNSKKKNDSGLIRRIDTLPIGKSLNISMNTFNRIIHEIPMNSTRVLSISIYDEYGALTDTVFIKNKLPSKNLSVTAKHTFTSDADTELEDIVNGHVKISWVEKTSNYQKVSEFFAYLTKADYHLEDFQVYHSLTEDNLEKDIPCFLFALEKANVDQSTIEQIKSTMFTQGATHNFIKRTAENFKLHIALHTLKPKKTQIDFNKKSYGNKSLPPINLACIAEHIFIIKPTNISKAALDHPELNTHPDFPSIYLRNGKPAKGSPKILDSHQVIAHLYQNAESLLKPIQLKEKLELINNKYGEITSLDKSMVTENWFKEIGNKPKNGSKPFKHLKVQDFTVVYFDLETLSDSTENIQKRFPELEHQGLDHIPYCASWKVEDGETQVSYGVDCVKAMLKSVPDGNYLMIAHHLGFDIRFLIKHLTHFTKNTGIIDNGSRMKQLVGSFKNRNFVFKDSLAFIEAPLSKLPEMFPNQDSKITLEKECFPHERMNIDTFDSFIRLEGELEVDKATLIENATNINAFQDGLLDVKKYAMHYCMRDVDVLAASFKSFRTLILKEYNQDVFNHISMPGLSNTIFNNAGCYKGCYSLSGPSLSFVRKAIVGGRVMTRDNEKHHTTHKIDDFDAVSLYPSAMHRLPGFAKGMPKLHRQVIPTCDYHITKVKITKLGKNLHFPLQSIKEGANSRKFTNEIVGKELIMDQYALEDLVKFQEVEYEVIEGLYWSDGFNNQIINTIETMFKSRLIYKKEKNPMQNVIKLCMNASYGKLIQKPIIKGKTIVRGEAKIKEYTCRRINHLIRRTPINDNIAIFEEHKSLMSFASPAHLGVQILSMSKRIMNEVMCLTEEMGIPPWYQDTDSMHLDKEAVPSLSYSFKEKYGRELIGNQLGQFHSDFSLDGAEGEIYAVESWFIGKKTYLDKLVCSGNDVTGVHKRMKGIPGKCITDPEATYQKLFNGESCEFDLTKANPLLVDSRTQRVMKRKKFIRVVKA